MSSNSLSNGPPVFANMALSLGSDWASLTAPSCIGVTLDALTTIGLPLPDTIPSGIAIIAASHIRVFISLCPFRDASAALILFGVLLSDCQFELLDFIPVNQSVNFPTHDLVSSLYTLVCSCADIPLR